MLMLLKNNWMRYLIIGISVIFVSLSVFSCRKYLDTVEWGYTVEWIYKNSSGFDLTIEAYNREDVLFASRYVSNDVYTTFEIWHSQIVVPFSFRHTSVYNFIPTDYAERIRIKFQNGACLSYPEQTLEKNIFNPELYEGYEESLNKNPEAWTTSKSAPTHYPHAFTLTWTFTPEDVELAQKCQEPEEQEVDFQFQ